MNKKIFALIFTLTLIPALNAAEPLDITTNTTIDGGMSSTTVMESPGGLQNAPIKAAGVDGAPITVTVTDASRFEQDHRLVNDAGLDEAAATKIDWGGGAISSVYANWTFGNGVLFQDNSLTASGTNTGSKTTNKMITVGGGAIYSDNGAFKFGNNTQFISNMLAVSKGYNDTRAYGGAIYVKNGDFTFGENTLFKGNNVSLQGGNEIGIPDGQLYMANGGAIANSLDQTAASNFTFGNNTWFLQNFARTITGSEHTATAQGGAIFLAAMPGTVWNFNGITLFKQNAVFGDGFVDGGGLGGAIYMNIYGNGHVNFNGMTIFDNNAAEANTSITTDTEYTGMIDREDFPYLSATQQTIAQGGAIEFAEQTEGDPGTGSLNFNGPTQFINNYAAAAISYKGIQEIPHVREFWAQTLGGAIDIWTYAGPSVINFNDIAEFSGNQALASLSFLLDAPSGILGTLQSFALGGAIKVDENDQKSALNFNKDVLFTDNHADSVVELSPEMADSIFGQTYGLVSVRSMGGAIYASFSDGGNINFNGNTEFIENYTAISNTVNEDGYEYDATKFTALAYGGAIYATGSNIDFGDISLIKVDEMKGDLNFNMSAGEHVLFKDNYTSITNGGAEEKKLSSIYFSNSSATFNLAAGAYADIHDPMSGVGYVVQDGDGAMYLWGDNSEFYGILDFRGGDTYLMFDENDAWADRRTASFDKTQSVYFADGSSFYPMVNPTQMASINDTLTFGDLGYTDATKDDLISPLQTSGGIIFFRDAAGNPLAAGGVAQFLPYNMSSLEAGTYVYNGVDYSAFRDQSGLILNNLDCPTCTTRTGFWENDLAIVEPSENTTITIKRGLEGYQGLGKSADVLRMTDFGNELANIAKRHILDTIYYTGLVSDDARGLLTATDGGDKIAFAQLGGLSIRRFGKAIYTRVQNRDSQNLIPDDHLWVNAAHKWVDQDAVGDVLGYTYDPFAFTIGYDRDLAPDSDWILGGAFTHAFGQAAAKAGPLARSTDDVSEYMGAIYTKYQPSRFFITTHLGFGFMENKTEFVTPASDATGKHNVYGLFSNGTAGYNFGEEDNSLKIEPYVGWNITYIKTEAYQESGPGARKFSSHKDWVADTPLGLIFSKDIKTPRYLITPQIDLAYVLSWNTGHDSVRASFVENTFDFWNVNSGYGNKNTYRGTFGLKINSNERPFAAHMGYSVDYHSGYSDQMVFGTLRWDF